MKNKMIVIILAIFIILLNATLSYGFSAGDLTGSTLPSEIEDPINKVGNNIITIIASIGSIIRVVVLVVLGIKYMLASVEEKAEYKKTLMPYVIGAVILFGASAIAGIIYNIAINL